MPKTISALEAKNNLGSVVNWVVQNQDEVIIERRGTPTAVIMPFTEYQKVQELKEQNRRQEALQRLRELRDQVRARNQGITTEEQAIEIADQITREAIHSLVEKGRIRFES